MDWGSIPERYIAIDWGTTRRRSYLVDRDGAIVDRLEDGLGAGKLAATAYVPAFAELRRRFGQWQIVAAGMVGARSGWVEMPYVPAPAGLDQLTAHAHLVAEQDVVLLPGIASDSAAQPDVMRGEEVQALGALAAGLAPPGALLCQPGTHNKWIQLCDDRIERFTTVMTGELFALLRSGGTLAAFLDEPVTPGRAFREGVERGLAQPGLTAALFEARAGALLGKRPTGENAAFLSGLLIGADVRIGIADERDAHVHMLASGVLADLYADAIALAGARVTQIDSSDAFVAGIHAVRSRACRI